MVVKNSHNNTLESLRVLDVDSYGKNTIIVYNDYKVDKMPAIIGEIIEGSATSTYNIHKYVSLKVSNLGDKVIRQSFEYYASLSYKIKRCLFKTCLNTLINAEGYRSRVGVFDDYNNKLVFDGSATGGTGLFFQLENNELSIGIRYGVGENGEDTIIPQSEWNINKLEKESFFNYRRWDKLQAFEISYNTIGLIEWCIIIDGVHILLHRYDVVNQDFNTIHRHSLPIRYEIEKIKDIPGTGELRQFEESISIEYNPNSNMDGNNGNGSTSLSPVLIFKNLGKINNRPYTISSVNNYVPLFSVRLKIEFNRDPIVNYILDGLCITDGSYIQLSIIKNPTFLDNQPIWQDTDYTLQYDTNSNIIEQDGNDIINEYYIIPRQNFPSNNLEGRPIPISSDISGNPDIFTIAARRIDTGSSIATCYFNFKWSEDS